MSDFTQVSIFVDGYTMWRVNSEKSKERIENAKHFQQTVRCYQSISGIDFSGKINDNKMGKRTRWYVCEAGDRSS